MKNRPNRKPPIIEALIASIPLLITSILLALGGMYLLVKYAPQAFSSVPVDFNTFVIPFISVVILVVLVGFLQRFIKIYSEIKRDYKKEKRQIKRNRR